MYNMEIFLYLWDPRRNCDCGQGMVGLMVKSAEPMVRKWEECIETQKRQQEEVGVRGVARAEIKVDEDLRGVSADVISRVCFGTSYAKGKQVFSKLRSLQKTISHQGFLFGVTNLGYVITSLLLLLFIHLY